MQRLIYSRTVRSESGYANYSALLVFLFFILARTTMFAGSATWNLSPTTGDWNTAANWMPATIPNGATDIATFGASNMVDVSLSADVEVNTIAFNAEAGVYTIATGDTSTLNISGAGIINDSGVFQNFAAEAGPSSYGAIIFSQNASAGSQTKFTSEGSPYSPAVILFEDNATAGSGQFTNIGSAVAFQGGGYLQFGGNSSAENAVLTNQGGTVENALGGQIGFAENATAANATITNNAGPKNTFGNTSGGTLAFSGSATAGNATITNKGSAIDGGTGGVTFFGGDAGQATLIAEGGTNGGAGGQIVFMSPATGGSSRIEIFGNGTFDFRSEGALTIGSLEGDGLALLGPDLTIGSNDLNTDFAGVLKDLGGSTLTKIGTGTLTLSGANTYLGATTVNGGKLAVDGSITSDVTVNTGGTLGGAGTVNNVTINSGGTVAPGGTKILTVNGNYQQNGNSTLALLISGTDPTDYDQLLVNGSVTVSSGAVLELNFNNAFAPHAGDTFNLLTFASITGNFTTVDIVGLAADFQYTIRDDGNGHLQLKALNDGVATSSAKKLLNISTRLDILTGEKVLIGGFIINGSIPKKVILRAIGPSLQLVGLTDVLADPVLELHEPDDTLITNDNWKDSQEQEILDTGLAPGDDLESAIVATLDPGAYTAIVHGVNDGTGVGLVETYDIDQTAGSELANISTRGFVQSGNNVMIGGFILGGVAIESSEVIVRAIGPSLGSFGITDPLQDPILELHDQDGALIASNDNWKDSQELEIEAAGLAPTDDRESAISATLMPNAYTAIVFGNDNATGVGLVEVYRLQP